MPAKAPDPTGRHPPFPDSLRRKEQSRAARRDMPLASALDEQEQSGLPLPRCMEGSKQPLAAAFPRMQERRGVRLRAGRHLELVPSRSVVGADKMPALPTGAGAPVTSGKCPFRTCTPTVVVLGGDPLIALVALVRACACASTLGVVAARCLCRTPCEEVTRAAADGLAVRVGRLTLRLRITAVATLGWASVVVPDDQPSAVGRVGAAGVQASPGLRVVQRAVRTRLPLLCAGAVALVQLPERHVGVAPPATSRHLPGGSSGPSEGRSSAGRECRCSRIAGRRCARA